MRKQKRFLQRKRRVKAKITMGGYPRLSVFRSNRYIYAQLIDNSKGKTLVSSSSKDLAKSKTGKRTKTQIARLVGEELAKKARRAKIIKVRFDRGAYKYHGRVKALAEGAREKGLKF